MIIKRVFKMDETDKILKLLQEDSAQPVADIAENWPVGHALLAAREVEKAGIIRKRVALPWAS